MENPEFVLFQEQEWRGIKSLLRKVVKMLQLWKVIYKEELRIRMEGCIGALESEKLGWRSMDHNYLTSSSAQPMNAMPQEWTGDK
jgi:hypothetical protein